MADVTLCTAVEVVRRGLRRGVVADCFNAAVGYSEGRSGTPPCEVDEPDLPRRYPTVFHQRVTQEDELKEYQRLRAEGHWSAASEFREAEPKRLRAAGRNRQQARQESWDAMLDRYTPQHEQMLAGQPALKTDHWSEADADSELDPDEQNRQAEIAAELEQLHLLTNGQPTDADRDIDFAYRNMGLSTVTPLLAPSGAAWCWYLYARKVPDKFLEICAKRRTPKQNRPARSRLGEWRTTSGNGLPCSTESNVN